MKRERRIGIIGWGNMGMVLGEVLRKKKKWQVYLYDKNRKRIRKIKGPGVCKDNNELIKKSGIVILAIKPRDVKEFLCQMKDSLVKHKPLLVTIAAGISTGFFQNQIKGLRVIRVMPNLAAGVKESVSFLCKGSLAKSSDLRVVEEIFSSVGEVFKIRESFLNKVTAISGSGPGYIYYIMDGMYKSALRLGFTKEIARRMILAIFLGAAKLAKFRGGDFEALMREVASPKGTTEVALEVFKKRKLTGIIDEAVSAAYQRAGEISSLFH